MENLVMIRIRADDKEFIKSTKGKQEIPQRMHEIIESYRKTLVIA